MLEGNTVEGNAAEGNAAEAFGRDERSIAMGASTLPCVLNSRHAAILSKLWASMSLGR